jgi:endonuclease/exonuclease/phosphatase family metal-dependent hydrolase
VEGCPQGCTTIAERADGPLRVLSLNMLHGRPEFENLDLRLDLIAAEIRRLDADVVLLQEVPWTKETGNVAEYLAVKLGYNWLYYRANGNRWLINFEEGEAILSSLPLKDPRTVVLEPQPGFFESRVALGATADTPWGELTFFVTHLTNKDPAVNQGQAESLKAFVEAHTSGLAVVAGDFNALLEGSHQNIALARGWTDAYRAVHPLEEGLTCCIDDLAAGPEEPLEKRIDYIFLVAGGEERWRILDTRFVFDRSFPVEGGWQWVSDHIGLLVEIEF